MCYVPSRDVVVCTTSDTAVVVVDGAARELLGILPVGSPSLLRADGVSNKLYCLLTGSDELAAIDCRDMSIEARIRLAARPSAMAFDSIADRMWVTSPDYGCLSLVDGRTNSLLGLFEAGDSPGDITWVPRHRQMYVVDEPGQAVLVFGDSAVTGLCGGQATGPVRSLATVVRGVLFLPERTSASSSPSCLLDVGGRRVMGLQPGPNDIRALAPGVYFVHSTLDNRQPQMAKVVVTR
jgi:DNA-binding beta-propeller fold protein YncE